VSIYTFSQNTTAISILQHTHTQKVAHILYNGTQQLTTNEWSKFTVALSSAWISH